MVTEGLKWGLKEGVVSAQQQDPFRARHDTNPTARSVKGMSPLDYGIIRNSEFVQ